MPAVLEGLRHPIVLAPLAGGVTTPELVAAVGEAGGVGFIGAGYRTAADTAAQIDAVRALTAAPFGVNVFVPRRDPVNPAALAAYLASLAPEAERLGVAVGEPRDEDDAWEAKISLLTEHPVPVVSFTFACPPAAVVAALRAAGSEVWVTVTSAAEARAAREAGAQALVCQGAEAGGHRGSWDDRDDAESLGLLALLRLVAAEVDLPLVAAGGIADGAAVAAVVAAGARAAQIGTAFLRAEEAGTTPAHRSALGEETPTAPDAGVHGAHRPGPRQPLHGRARGRRGGRLPPGPPRHGTAARGGPGRAATRRASTSGPARPTAWRARLRRRRSCGASRPTRRRRRAPPPTGSGAEEPQQGVAGAAHGHRHAEALALGRPPRRPAPRARGGRPASRSKRVDEPPVRRQAPPGVGDVVLGRVAARRPPRRPGPRPRSHGRAPASARRPGGRRRPPPRAPARAR